MGFLDTVRFILDHPLNSGRPVSTLSRYATWQLRSRLSSGPIEVPFVEGTRLLVSRGQTGATGNVYTGLHEVSEMAFVLHMLRPGELFVDVGANVGSYTVLASGAAAGMVVAFEPGRAAHAALLANVRHNDLTLRVELRQEAVGASVGEVAFTQASDTLNHVALPSEKLATSRVPMTTLDTALAGRHPLLMKIDVEGFESSVVAGASDTLADEQLQAVIMETNGSGARYSASDDALHSSMLSAGFQPCRYDPFTRNLQPSAARSTDGNTIYVRDHAEAARRVGSARKFNIAGRNLL